MPRSKTHFEQIPVEVVKKIVEAQSAEKKQNDTNDGKIVETPASETEPSKLHSLRRKGA